MSAASLIECLAAADDEEICGLIVRSILTDIGYLKRLRSAANNNATPKPEFLNLCFMILPILGASTAPGLIPYAWHVTKFSIYICLRLLNSSKAYTERNVWKYYY